MKWIFLFFHFILMSFNLYSQVDEYKMRHEQTSHQFKRQPISELPQRISIIDSQTTRNGYESRILEGLEYHSELYKLSSSYQISRFSYRGNDLNSKNYWIDGVNLGSELNQNLYPTWNFYAPDAIDKIELLYGSNIALNNPSNSASLSLRTTNLFDETNTVKARIGYYLYTPMISGSVHFKKKNWANITSISYLSNNGYVFSDSSRKYSSETNFSILNKFQIKFNERSQLTIFGQYSVSDSNKFHTYNSNVLAPVPYQKLGINPAVFVYLQWKKTSEESKIMSQMTSTLSYLHTSYRDSSLFLNKSNSFYSGKLSLQVNAFKNLGSRAVYYYGGNIEMEGIYDDMIHPEHRVYFMPEPIISSNIYFKKEIRPSSDYSWIFGANLGVKKLKYQLDNTNFSEIIFYDKLLPSASVQASWIRHLCENSNYSINLWGNYTSPTLSQMRPVIAHEFQNPNPDLKPEKSVMIEGNIYRKLEDKLEIHASIFYQLKKDAVLLRDYYDPLSMSPMNLPTQNQNLNIVSDFGGNLELKYHVSKCILVYGNGHYQKRNSHSDTQNYSLLTPLCYGSFGVKYRGNRVFLQLWTQYNLGNSSPSLSIRYQELFKNIGFDSYASFHFSGSYKLGNHFQLTVNLHNILNQKTMNYGSYIENMGLNGGLTLGWAI